MRLIFVALAFICFLGAEADNVGVPQASSGTSAESLLPTDPTAVEPLDATTTADYDTNSTDDATVLQITDYQYVDWPKIGYEIFMQKMFDALQTLKYYVSLDPMLLKITRTYVFTNDTDLDYDYNNNSTEMNSTELDSNEVSSTESVESIETNTESPIVIEIYDDSGDSSSGNNTSSSKEQSKEDEEVNKTKTEHGGFFSGIAKAVASFYHTITGWF